MRRIRLPATWPYLKAIGLFFILPCRGAGSATCLPHTGREGVPQESRQDGGTTSAGGSGSRTRRDELETWGVAQASAEPAPSPFGHEGAARCHKQPARRSNEPPQWPAGAQFEIICRSRCLAPTHGPQREVPRERRMERVQSFKGAWAQPRCERRTRGRIRAGGWHRARSSAAKPCAVITTWRDYVLNATVAREPASL